MVDRTMGPGSSLSYTRRLEEVPPPSELFGRARSLALAELLINSRPYLRYHTLDRSFDHHVRVSSGSGDEASIWLSESGCVVRGFDHESDLSPWTRPERQIWPGLTAGFPTELSEGPRLNTVDGVEDLTFLLWWLSGGPWTTGNLPPNDGLGDTDGSHFLLEPLVSDARGVVFLSDYYEVEMPSDVLRRLGPEQPINLSKFDDVPGVRAAEEIEQELQTLGIGVCR